MKKLFTKKLEHNQKKTLPNKKIYKDYYEILEKDNFVTFEEILCSSFLENNISLSSVEKTIFQQKIANAYQEKLDMVFQDFIITWNKNLRFSSTKNIPTLVQKESHNVESINFFEDESNSIFNKILKTYNNLLKKLIFDEQRYVEVTEGIVVYISRETTQLKLAFSEKSSDLNKE